MDNRNAAKYLAAALLVASAACSDDGDDNALASGTEIDAQSDAGTVRSEDEREADEDDSSDSDDKQQSSSRDTEMASDEKPGDDSDTKRDSSDDKETHSDDKQETQSGSGTDKAQQDKDDEAKPDPEPALSAIEPIAANVYTQANDLRGVTYSKSGKIWASGHSDADPENRKLVLARFNPDGTPDSSFADGGFLIRDIVPGDEQSMGLVELEGGDVVVQANVADGHGGEPIADIAGGSDAMRPSGTDVILVRFSSSGELVTSFGDNGVAKLVFGWEPEHDESWPAPTYDSSIEQENRRFSTSGFPADTAWGVRLDSSGDTEKLVVNGHGPAKKVDADQRYDNDRYVLRVLASTGEPDPSWNGGSPFTFHTRDAQSDGGRRALVEADGSVLSAGYTNFGEGLGNHVVLIKLRPDGTVDDSFGFGSLDQPGVAVFNPFVDDGGMAECYGVTRQGDHYVTTGYGRATGADMSSSLGYSTTDGVDLVSFALKADGSGLDAGWGIQGTRAVQSEELGLMDSEDRGRDVVALPDGRVVHAGRFGVGPAVVVLTPEGAVDESVGERGVIRFDPVGEMTSHFYGIALSEDGKHVVATTSNHADGVLVAVLEVAD